jgi:hypothetical protein
MREAFLDMDESGELFMFVSVSIHIARVSKLPDPRA